MGRLVAGLLVVLLPFASAQAWEADRADDVAPPSANASFIDILNVTLTSSSQGLRFDMDLNGSVVDAPDGATITFLWVYTTMFEGADLYQSNDGTIICTYDGNFVCRDTQEKVLVVGAQINETRVSAIVKSFPDDSSEWRVAGGATLFIEGNLTAQDFTQGALPGQNKPGGDGLESLPSGATDDGTPIWTIVAIVLMLSMMGYGLVRTLRR